MFYLSKNLKSLMERVPLTGESSDTCAKHRNRDPLNPVIVQVVAKKCLVNKYCNIKIFDGIEVQNAILDEDVWYPTGRSTSHSSDERPCLQIGSVLLINEYSFVSLCQLLTSLKKAQHDLGVVSKNSVENSFDPVTDHRKLIKIICFTLIGLGLETNDAQKQILPQPLLPGERQVESEPEQDDQETEPTHTIATITACLNSNDNWSIRAVVSNKRPIKEFRNQNGFCGTFGRLQLRDKTGYIEVVAFNDTEALKLFSLLELDKVYVISNAEVKKSRKSIQIWGHLYKFDFEMSLTASTFIRQVEYNKVLDTFTEEPSPILNKHFEQTFKKPASPKTNSISLNLLVLQKCNSLLNAFGYVLDIDKVHEQIIVANELLSVRRFRMIDESNTTVSVALWGKQAEKHDLVEEKKIFYLNKCKLTNFGGISLSVIKITTISDVTDSTTSEIVALKNWCIENNYLIDQRKNKKHKLN